MEMLCVLKVTPKLLRAACRGRWILATGLAVGGLFAWIPAIASSEAASCDAVSGASCAVVGIKTTYSQASIYWTESRHQGTRTFCYGIGSPDICGPVSSRAFGAKPQVVTGLKAHTKYAFKFFGTYDAVVQSVVTGNFITDSSSCGSTVITAVEVYGVVLSASGDSLQNAIVTLVKPAVENMLIITDTTDRSGGFHFQVDPGTYSLSVEYPPFTSPPTLYPQVIAGKPLNIPDLVLTGAYQLGGTVVTSGKGDSIPGAVVTVYNKSNNAKVDTRTTDYKGHFNFGLKAGDYLINAEFGGKSLPAPIGFKVAKSMELANLQLGVTLAIRGKAEGRARSGPDGARYFDAKGARIRMPSRVPGHYMQVTPGGG